MAAQALRARRGWLAGLAGAGILALAACGFTGPAEKTSLAETCSLPDAELADAAPGPFLQMETAGKALVFLSKENQYGLLEMPGCRVTRLPDVAERMGLASAMQVRPDGARLFSTYVRGEPSFVYWYAASARAAPVAVAPDKDAPGPEFPVLSQDGKWLAVLRTIRTPQASSNEIILREAAGSKRRSLWPAGLEWSWSDLVAIDVAKEEAVLSRGLREYVWVHFDGRVLRGPVNTGEVQAQPPTFRWVGNGWFAWDAYRDSGAEQARLANAPANFTARVERWRLIQHGAISPDARHAALSLETNYGRLLSLRDAVVIYETASGKEIFRKYLPRFTRSRAAFLGHRQFAYGEAGRVRVLSLP